MIVTASKKMEKYILEIFNEMEVQLGKYGFKIAKDKFTAWEKDYIEVRTQLKGSRTKELFNLWNESSYDAKFVVKDFPNKKGKIVIEKKIPVLIAWLYIHTPKKEFEKEVGRKIPDSEFLHILEEWSEGRGVLDFYSVNKIKKRSFDEVAKSDDDEIKIAYISQTWEEFNKKLFNGKMKKPIFYLQKSNSKNQHGVWYSSKQQMGLNRHMFNSKPHFDETLIHEMCHQAVSEIDGIKDANKTLGGHGVEWQTWMKKCGLSADRYANFEKSLAVRPEANKNFESGLNGSKLVPNAKLGDPVKFFNLSEGEWILGRLVKSSSKFAIVIPIDGVMNADTLIYRYWKPTKEKLYNVSNSEKKEIVKKLPDDFIQKVLLRGLKGH